MTKRGLNHDSLSFSHSLDQCICTHAYIRAYMSFLYVGYVFEICMYVYIYTYIYICIYVYVSTFIFYTYISIQM